MRDRRENILKRIVEIARGIKGVTVYRNADDPTDMLLPAIDVRDGNEEAQGLEAPRYAGKDMIVMTPVIAIFAATKDADPAATLSRLRMALRAAIFNDAAIRAETGSNGNIRYISSATEDKWGATLHGEERITMEFTYPLLPVDFGEQGMLSGQFGKISLG